MDAIETRSSAIRLPTHLAVRFEPNNLPPGAVDLHDLSQFLMGLQCTLDAKVRHDFGVENIESSQFRLYRFIIAEVRSGSVECDVVFNILSGNMFNVSAPVTFAAGAAAAAFGPKLLEAFASGAAGEAGKRLVEPIASALQRMPDAVRRYLADFVGFLRNATSADPTAIDTDLLDHAEQGLKDMAQVGAREAYADRPITIRTDVEAESPIVFDSETRARILDLLDSEVAGKEDISVRGEVSALDADQNFFRVFDIDKRKNIKCRFDENQENMVVGLAAVGNSVLVEGRPHYRKGSTRTGLPLYVKVSTVQEMPTLWNSGNQAS